MRLSKRSRSLKGVRPTRYLGEETMERQMKRGGERCLMWG